MRVGTPPVIQMAVLEAALWTPSTVIEMDALSARASIRALRAASSPEVEARLQAAVELASVRATRRRGAVLRSRSVFTHGHAAMQALIARGVIGDFRAPDIMRFGFCPLYNTAEDVSHAAAVLCEIIATGEWDRAEFKQRKAVT
jgi:kynureninase